MRLYILKPLDGGEDWDPWYDKCFGMVVRASTVQKARKLASLHCGDEGKDVWVQRNKTSCKSLQHHGSSGIIIKDVRCA